MTYMVSVRKKGLKVKVGDAIRVGDYLGENAGTMDSIQSPFNGVVSNIFITSDRQSVVLYLDFDAFI